MIITREIETLVSNSPKNPYLNQGNSKNPSIIPVTWNPEYPHPFPLPGAMSRNGQRQGYLVAWMCTATPPPGKIDLGSPVKLALRRFLF